MSASSSIGAAPSQTDGRWFSELEVKDSPFYRVSSWHDGDQFITRYDWNPRSRFASLTADKVEALLKARSDLIGLFSPEMLLSQLLRKRCFIIIRKDTVAFSSFSSGRIPTMYQDYFSEGLLVHPTTCPRGHHFELESARRYVHRMGPACPVSPDHSIGELVEDEALRQKLLQVVPELDELSAPPPGRILSTVIALVQGIWLNVKHWIESLWLKARRRFCRDEPTPAHASAFDKYRKENCYVVQTPMEIFNIVTEIFPCATVATDVNDVGAISVSVSIPNLRHPIVFRSAIQVFTLHSDLEELAGKIALARGAVIEEPIDGQEYAFEMELQDWQGFRRKRYELEKMETCQAVLVRYLKEPTPETLGTLRFLGLAPEQIDRGDVSEGDLRYFLLAMDRLESLSPSERGRIEAALEKTFPLIAKKAFIERVRQERIAIKNPKENIWLSLFPKERSSRN